MDTPKTSARILERVLATAAVVLSLVVCIWARQKYSPISPLTAAYLVEVVVVSFVCGVGLWRSRAEDSSLSILAAWVSIGMLAGFTLMGLWSIGVFFVPVDAMFITAALMATNRKHASMPSHLGACGLAAFAQAAMMLCVIRWMH